MGASLATVSTQRCPPDTAHALFLFSERSVRSVAQTAEAPSAAIRPLKQRILDRAPQLDLSIALLRENAYRLKNPVGMMISIPEETTHLASPFSVVSQIVSLLGVRESVILLI